MIKCRWCGEEFEPAQTAQKYCPECRGDPEVARARARKRKQEQLERQRVETPVFADQVKKTCLICKREFNPASNRQKWCFVHRKQGRQEARTRYMRKYRARKKQVAHHSM